MDLGVNVHPDRFVEAAKAHKPCILMMSVYTSNALPVIGEVERALRAAGLKGAVRGTIAQS